MPVAKTKQRQESSIQNQNTEAWRWHGFLRFQKLFVYKRRLVPVSTCRYQSNLHVKSYPKRSDPRRYLHSMVETPCRFCRSKLKFGQHLLLGLLWARFGRFSEIPIFSCASSTKCWLSHFLAQISFSQHFISRYASEKHRFVTKKCSSFLRMNF